MLIVHCAHQNSKEIEMNIYTKEVMDLLKCDAETAQKVLDAMSYYDDIKFNSCSTSQFNFSAKRCFKIVTQ